jgi:hypothetical protein
MTKLSQKSGVWKSETLLNRFMRCRAMLRIHGFLSDAESDKVHRRIVKVAKRERKEAG